MYSVNVKVKGLRCLLPCKLKDKWIYCLNEFQGIGLHKSSESQVQKRSISSHRSCSAQSWETAHHQIHNLNTSWEVYCLPCCIDPHGLGLHRACHYYKNLLQLNYKLLLLLTQYSTVAYSWQHFGTKGKKKSRMEKLICALSLHQANVNYLLNMKSVKLLKNSFLGRSHRSIWTNSGTYFCIIQNLIFWNVIWQCDVAVSQFY